jgi:hypothetical protein
MAAFGKLDSLTQYGRQIENKEPGQNRGLELGLRLSELPGAAFAAITLVYVVAALARLAW